MLKLRWLPFFAFGLASIWASARTSQGYRSPMFQWDITGPALANALTKTPHITSMIFIFLLATLAVGTKRLWLAAALTFAVGLSWEVVQMWTIGNNARLADLAPDLVGILVGWASVSVLAQAWRRVTPTRAGRHQDTRRD